MTGTVVEGGKIEQRIPLIRGERVIVDEDLAAMAAQLSGSTMGFEWTGRVAVVTPSEDRNFLASGGPKGFAA